LALDKGFWAQDWLSDLIRGQVVGCELVDDCSVATVVGLSGGVVCNLIDFGLFGNFKDLSLELG
jgi:hypothetical protein